MASRSRIWCASSYAIRSATASSSSSARRTSSDGDDLAHLVAPLDDVDERTREIGARDREARRARFRDAVGAAPGLHGEARRTNDRPVEIARAHQRLHGRRVAEIVAQKEAQDRSHEADVREHQRHRHDDQAAHAGPAHRFEGRARARFDDAGAGRRRGAQHRDDGLLAGERAGEVVAVRRVALNDVQVFVRFQFVGRAHQGRDRVAARQRLWHQLGSGLARGSEDQKAHAPTMPRAASPRRWRCS
jgi:hypothetical protein